MKKIFTVAQVKNESDIIESFCRYNLTYSDGMLILDNGSVDNTVEIIQNLIDEGLPITLVKIEPEKLFGMTYKTYLAHKAFDEFDADLVLPLDADEFLCHVDGINPREVLESLQDMIEYHIPWRTYVYEREPDITLGFMPNNFTHYRNPILEDLQAHAGKAPISKFLAKNLHAQFTLGSHWLEYPNELSGTVTVETVKELAISHFPIRSHAQVLLKTITNSIAKMKVIDNSLPFEETLKNHQLGILFKVFKDKGYIKNEELVTNSIEYSLYNKGERTAIAKQMLKYEDEITIFQPMNVHFCANKLTLRHTNYEKTPELLIRSILSEINSTVMYLSSQIRKNEQALLESAHQCDVTTQENIALTQQVNILTKHADELSQQVNILTEQADDRLQQVNILTKHADDLSQQLNILTEHADDLSQQVNTLTEHADDLSQQVNILTEQAADRLQQVNILTQHADDLSQQVNILTEQADDLSQQVNILTQHKNELETQIVCIYNSRTWKIGNFFKKFYRFFIPYKG